jgi:hypothetical protein
MRILNARPLSKEFEFVTFFMAHAMHFNRSASIIEL